MRSKNIEESKMITNIILTYSLIAGIMSICLFVFGIFFEKNKKKSRNLLIWAVLFLASSFLATEYAFWLEGYNLFELTFKFNFPLLFYFGIWFVFIIWLFESRKERVVWVIFLILVIIAIIIATQCMNCVRF